MSLWLSGVAGNFASWTDASLHLVGTPFTLETKVSLEAFPPTNQAWLISRDNVSGTDRAWATSVYTDGKISVDCFTSGGVYQGTTYSTASAGLTALEPTWIRITCDGTDKWNFYKSADGSSWTQIGTEVTDSRVPANTASLPMRVGGRGNGTSLFGYLHRARIYTDTSQTTKVFDADFTTLTDQEKLARQFTEDAYGATVTVNGSQSYFVPRAAEPNYLYLPGTSGNYASTPDSVPLSITGDIDIRCKVAMDDWTPASTQALVAKSNGTADYHIDVINTGAVRLAWYQASAAAKGVTSSVATGFVDGTAHWVRATLDVDGGAGGVGRVTFYTSDDGATWTQLGTTGDTGDAPTDIRDSTASLALGAYNTGTTGLLAGKMYRAQIYNGIDGTLVFDADFTTLTQAEVEAGSFTEDANNATVTLNGTAWAYVEPVTTGLLSEAELLFKASNRYTDGSPKLPDLSGNDHHGQWGSAAGADTNDPLYLEPDGGVGGTQYLYLPGADTDYAHTPDHARLDLSTGLQVELDLALNDYTPAGWKKLFDKASAYSIQMASTTGLLYLYWWDSAAIKTITFANPGFTDGVRYELKVTLSFSGSTATGLAYYRLAGADTWIAITPSGTQTSSSIDNTASALQVGPTSSGGKIYRARLWDGVDGTLVFDADFTDRTRLKEPFATFTEKANDAVVTINRSATGVPSTVVDKPMLVFDGVDDYITVADHADLDFAADESFTVMVVSRQESAATRILLDKGAAAGPSGNAYTIFTNSSKQQVFGIADGAAAPNDTNPAVYVLRTEHVIAGVRNVADDDLEVYRDGIGTGTPTTDTTTATLANATSLFIGKYAGGALYFQHGQVMAVALWRRALTDTEIAEAGRELTWAVEYGSLEGKDMLYILEQIALAKNGTSTRLERQGQLNAIAGTTALGEVGALKALGATSRELTGALNELAGTTGLGKLEAARRWAYLGADYLYD